MIKHSALFVLAVTLIGCSGQVGEIIDLSRSTPDEFAVVKRKPLTVPPDFGLRPPEESDRDSQVALYDTRAEAQNVLFGNTTPKPVALASLDPTDTAFLDQAGSAEPGIRRLIEQESTDLIHADRNFVQDLLRDLLPKDPPGKVIDPVEAERRVRETVVLSQQKKPPSKAIIIERNTNSGFDWDSLWPF